MKNNSPRDLVAGPRSAPAGVGGMSFAQRCLSSNPFGISFLAFSRKTKVVKLLFGQVTGVSLVVSFKDRSERERKRESLTLFWLNVPMMVFYRVSKLCLFGGVVL